MFERFTDRARRVVVLAQEEARLLNHNYIGTEHLLLGLAHEGQGVAPKALESLGISLEAVRAQVEEIIGRGQEAPSGHIPFTPRAKKVLELSLREAKQLGHNYIGTEHILLGLIREGEGVAAQVLVKLGGDLSRVRQQVIQLLSGSAGGPEATAGMRPVAMPVPEDLREASEQLAEVRRQKEAAIQAQDFDRAAALRDAEEELLAGLAEREREWTAGVDLAAVIQEVQRLHDEVQRLHGEVQGLRELLRQHGIEPDGGTAQPA
jgi:ATP-dependent Clp protease ATP-binding subunit ClpA